jgi:hypothetical protein
MKKNATKSMPPAGKDYTSNFFRPASKKNAIGRAQRKSKQIAENESREKNGFCESSAVAATV